VYDPELNGVGNYAITFESNELLNVTMYNNWNFTSPLIWDSVDSKSFYYSGRKLYETEPYIIGSEFIPNIVLTLKPEKIIKKNKGEPSRFIGIPTSWPDVIEEFVIWQVSSDFNVDFLHAKSSINATNVMFVNIHFDFMLRTSTIEYVGMYNIVKQLGAVMAAIAPLLRLISPLLVLFFLQSLSKIILNKARMNYKLQLYHFFKTASD